MRFALLFSYYLIMGIEMINILAERDKQINPAVIAVTFTGLPRLNRSPACHADLAGRPGNGGVVSGRQAVRSFCSAARSFKLSGCKRVLTRICSGRPKEVQSRTWMLNFIRPWRRSRAGPPAAINPK